MHNTPRTLCEKKRSTGEPLQKLRRVRRGCAAKTTADAFVVILLFSCVRCYVVTCRSDHFALALLTHQPMETVFTESDVQRFTFNYEFFHFTSSMQRMNFYSYGKWKKIGNKTKPLENKKIHIFVSKVPFFCHW